MDKVLVTGYVPIPRHPRTAAEYGELGENLFKGLGGDFVIHPFYETVPQMWLAKYINKFPEGALSHSAGDNPPKNSMAYHLVNHQKFAWLLKASLLHPKAKSFVWMDYGIGRLRGVTPEVVNEFMADVRVDDFAIPGCWERDAMMISDFFPCWRFCGSLMVVPGDKVYPLYKAVKTAVLQHMDKARNVPWEVNSLAMAEPILPPIRWYKADHDSSMFTEYKKEAPHVDDPAV